MNHFERASTVVLAQESAGFYSHEHRPMKSARLTAEAVILSSKGDSIMERVVVMKRMLLALVTEPGPEGSKPVLALLPNSALVPTGARPGRPIVDSQMSPT